VNYELEFEIDQLPPMNTADGLHWTKRNKLKKEWEILVWAEILNQRPRLALSRAKISITRYSSGPEPDYDNLVQGGKFLLDALVLNEIIRDDKPGVIGKPDYRWIKTNPKLGKVVVKVIQIEDES